MQHFAQIPVTMMKIYEAEKVFSSQPNDLNQEKLDFHLDARHFSQHSNGISQSSHLRFQTMLGRKWLKNFCGTDNKNIGHGERTANDVMGVEFLRELRCELNYS